MRSDQNVAGAFLYIFTEKYYNLYNDMSFEAPVLLIHSFLHLWRSSAVRPTIFVLLLSSVKSSYFWERAGNEKNWQEANQTSTGTEKNYTIIFMQKLLINKCRMRGEHCRDAAPINYCAKAQAPYFEYFPAIVSKLQDNKNDIIFRPCGRNTWWTTPLKSKKTIF